MSQPELLRRVAAVLERLDIPYMVTGSAASSLWGEPRATHDIDLVVTLEEDAAPRLAGAFPADRYYLDAEPIREAVRLEGMFNLIDVDHGDKVDFWLLTAEAWDVVRFDRRRRMPFDGFEIWVSSPEDTILAKLRWARLSGGSARQIQDAVGVFAVQRGALDQAYLDSWASHLEVTDLLAEVRATAS